GGADKGSSVGTSVDGDSSTVGSGGGVTLARVSSQPTMPTAMTRRKHHRRKYPDPLGPGIRRNPRVHRCKKATTWLSANPATKTCTASRCVRQGRDCQRPDPRAEWHE